MLPITKLVETVSRGFRREKMVQNVTWLNGPRLICDSRLDPLFL